jgi:hypothetical protein
MILIRPFLRTNSERKNTAHLPLFFMRESLSRWSRP